ncbi:hypothetical protein GFS03_08320 [Sulfolobus sp. E5-1-F]|uniref:hypothetical protein n=1 Tax=Saccharolobus sp. E5-1-F TaxID=2663019 RepID=UPI001296A3E3|nr:hypothetical protein [Sulfolobus sp. E5-1-F]QGA54571.1 hypothetical protein GFS03_08320 [Sulfolobus sp. E5-1-F]
MSKPDDKFLEYAKAFLEVAESDLQASKLLWENNYQAQAVFYLQQSTEKMFKSFRSMYQYFLVEFFGTITEELLASSSSKLNNLKTLLQSLNKGFKDRKIDIHGLEGSLRKDYSHDLQKGLAKDMEELRGRLNSNKDIFKEIFSLLGYANLADSVDGVVNWLQTNLLSSDSVAKSKGQKINDIDLKLKSFNDVASALEICFDQFIQPLARLSQDKPSSNQISSILHMVPRALFSILILPLDLYEIAFYLADFEQKSRYPQADSNNKTITTPANIISKEFSNKGLYDQIYIIAEKILDNFKKTNDFLFKLHEKITQVNYPIDNVVDDLLRLMKLFNSLVPELKNSIQGFKNVSGPKSFIAQLCDPKILSSLLQNMK